MSALSRLRRQDSGNVAVQAALLLPALLGAILGICWFGLAFYAQNAIVYATREAARYAVVHGSSSGSAATPTDIANFAKSRVSGLIADQITVSVAFSPSNAPGSDVTVTAAYNMTPSAAMIGIGAMTFTRSVRMTILQ